MLQIVAPSDNWILERLADRLASKLPYAELVSTSSMTKETKLAFYVNYALYREPSGLIDVGFFTHLDEQHLFLERARRMDHCVCQARKYADWLLSHGVQHVSHIPMGYDSFRFRPKLVLGVVGLLDHPRKGRHLVEELRKLPFVEVLTTEGKMPEEELPAFYQRLDYVLIPATVEGGPMSLSEGLAMGKAVIAPEDVGMVSEFGITEHIRRYPAGNAQALVELVKKCYDEKLNRTRLVRHRTWDTWAEKHHHLFMQLLAERGIETPKPAVGFRFGMIHEIEVPLGIETRLLEDGIDEVGASCSSGGTVRRG